jgi:hypothetical protein
MLSPSDGRIENTRPIGIIQRLIATTLVETPSRSADSSLVRRGSWGERGDRRSCNNRIVFAHEIPAIAIAGVSSKNESGQIDNWPRGVTSA